MLREVAQAAAEVGHHRHDAAVARPRACGRSGLAATRAATASDERVAARSAVRAIPVWAWLTPLVVVSAVIRYALSRQAVAPWIMVDELIYSELAKSFASSGQFLIRDHSTAAYGVIYPALISPAWAAFKSSPMPTRRRRRSTR